MDQTSARSSGRGASSPPRVLFLSSCVRGGGAGFSLYYLLKHLDRSRIEPLVVVPDPGIFREPFRELGLRVVVPEAFPERTAQLRFSRNTAALRALSTTQNLIDSLRLVPRLVRLIQREQIDLVYCNNMMVKPIGAIAAQLARVPCVLHARNLHEKPFPVALYCQSVARLPAVQRVIANSAASAVPYQNAVPQKVTVLHNGVDLADYQPRLGPHESVRAALGAAPGQVLVGFTGNLIPRKGVDVLIRAAARIAATRPWLRFAIAGRVPIGTAIDYRAQYQALCVELGVADRFHFSGFVADVPSFVSSLDLLALPSLQEPFGRSIIEAMALGTCVVASDVGGIPEIVQHEKTGLLAPPGDVDALARAIARLADDAELRNRLSDRAGQTVRERFDVVVLTRTMEKLLLQALSRSRFSSQATCP